MSTYTVNSSASFQAALTSAKSGDTIQLAAGAYGGLSVYNKNYNKAVTITSADLHNPAVVTGMTMTGSSGLTFTHLTFDISGAAYTPFNFTNSSNLTLSYLNVHGSMDGNPQDDPIAINVSTSSHITVTNSEFQQAAVGFTDTNDQYLTVSNNSFHDIRYDGIHSAGSSNVTISKNLFTDFYPVGTPATGGDHPDAIQFYTYGTTASAHDITVTNNTIVRGNGAPIHGIFFDDEVGNLPAQNVTISNNQVLGEAYMAIYMDHAQSVSITGNTVQSYPDYLSYISLTNVDSATVTNNKSTKYVYNTGDTNLVTNNNKVLNVTGVDTQLSADANTQMISNVHTLTLMGLGNITATANGLNDHITGNLGNDTFIAGAGADTFTGGSGVNTYVFGAGSGADVINNFRANDTIDLSAVLHQGITPLVQDGSTGLTISFGAGSVQLLGVHPASLLATATGFALT